MVVSECSLKSGLPKAVEFEKVVKRHKKLSELFRWCLTIVC